MKLTGDVALEHGETVLLGTLCLGPAPELRVDGSEFRGRLWIPCAEAALKKTRRRSGSFSAASAVRSGISLR